MLDGGTPKDKMEDGTKNYHFNSEKMEQRVFEWQPGLDPTLRTKRSVGSPNRRWEDDLNEFTKTEEGHEKAQY